MAARSPVRYIAGPEVILMAIEKDVVQRFAPALSGGDGYIQIVLYPALPDEFIKMAGSEVGIKWGILSIGFT
jgi:hypothetical protein